MRSTAFFFGLASFIAASPALAQEGTSPPANAAKPQSQSPAPEPDPQSLEDGGENDKPKDRSAYISISPLHLLFPIVEVTGEFRVHERIGVAGIAGFGSVDPQQFSARNSGLKTSRFTVWELGGQFVGYPIGHFDHGMQLGVELLYAGVAGSASSSTTTVTGTGQGLAMGPFVGYKYTTPVGFSFNVQGGVEYVTARAEASGGGASASGSDSSVIPLLNVNVGWAF